MKERRGGFSKVMPSRSGSHLPVGRVPFCGSMANVSNHLTHMLSQTHDTLLCSGSREERLVVRYSRAVSVLTTYGIGQFFD